MTDPQKYWFPAKRYGMGWGIPNTWQGACVLLAFIIALAVSAYLSSPGLYPIRFSLCAAGLILALIIVMWIKGEPPRWRWGGKD